MPSLRTLLSTLLGVVAAGVFALPRSAAAQQPVTITGQVTSEVGTPLSDANVFIQLMNISVNSRGDGRYTIVIPAARVAGQSVALAVRLVGYGSKTAQLTLTGGAITQNFALTANPFQLGTVVVTGEGTQSTVEQLGTARANVTPQQIQRSNESSIITALAAKAPNVNVVSSSGQPGVSTYIQLRGLTTLTASDGQPLLVVDGMPVDNSIEQTPGFAPGLMSAANNGPQATNRGTDINPDDVENIEILKGPSAAAIYGSRAGQGVILITTKHGHAGQTHYTAKASMSNDNVNRVPYLERTYGMGSGGTLFTGCNDPTKLNCAPPIRGASWGGVLPAGTPTFDHAAEMFQTGHVYDNSLSISGGTDKTLFFVSGAYNYNRGMIVGSNNSYGRTALRFNGSHQISSELKVSSNISYAGSNGAYLNSSNDVSGLLLGAWRTPPNFNNLPYLDPVTHEPRATRFQNPGPNTDFASRIYDNPFFVANNQKNTATIARTFGDIGLDWQALSWLKFNEAIGADYSNDERLFGLPWTSGGTAALNNLGTANAALGLVTQGYVKNWQVDQTISATALHTFSSNFDGSLTIGNNVNSRNYSTEAITGWQLAAPRPFTLGNTTIIQPPNVYTSNVLLASFFGQAQATLWHQLTVTAALRDDGASTFGANNQFSMFPKASMAWNIIRQDVNSSPILTTVKLRAAYGESGTQPRPYVLGATFGSQLYNDGFATGNQSAPLGGLATNSVKPNPNLTSERQKEFETGVDIAFLRSFGDVSLTYYREATSGAIFAVPVAAFTGYGQEFENAANLWNRGFEVSLNLRPIQTKLFGWDVGVNWARNRSQVTSLPNGVTAVDIGGTNGLGGITGAAIKGQQAPVYYGTDLVRCGRSIIINGVNIDQVAGECLGAKKGALYIDASGYPQVDNQGQYVIGDPNRNWTGSVHTNFRIQKLSISALLDVQNGGDSYNGTTGALNYFGRSYATYYARVHNQSVKFGQNYIATTAGAAGEGAGTSVPLDQNWFQGVAGVFAGSNSLFIQHSGFAKLREITLAYTFDMPWIQSHTTFSSIELRVAGRNLNTWTSYAGIDPETSILGSASPLRGIDYFNIPQSRSYVFAVTLNR